MRLIFTVLAVIFIAVAAFIDDDYVRIPALAFAGLVVAAYLRAWTRRDPANPSVIFSEQDSADIAAAANAAAAAAPAPAPAAARVAEAGMPGKPRSSIYDTVCDLELDTSKTIEYEPAPRPQPQQADGDKTLCDAPLFDTVLELRVPRIAV